MGRKPKPTLRYCMRSKGGGEIKAYLTFKGRRFYGGRTDIYTNSKTFADFTTSGELKTFDYTAEQLEIRKLLQVISEAVLADINTHIKAGQKITSELFQAAMEAGRAAALQQRVIWDANREWNKRVTEAAREGEQALAEFYRENPPFATLYPKPKKEREDKA
nr:unnamed protein product [uncultured bacterium]